MCGITGLIDKKGNLDRTKTLRDLSLPITHRGPDDYAEYVGEQCAFAIRRLAILDLTVGIYPFKSLDGDIELVLNGEIYNYLELRDELAKAGFKFQTHCDAEVVLNGFIHWGNDVFKKLRGMFAVAIWSNATKKLTLVRDRVGIKPIYYIDNDAVFLFSSEAKSFYNLDSSLFQKKLNYKNVETLLGFMYLPNSKETIVDGIKKIPPATVMEVQNGVISFTKYWQLSDTKENTSISFTEAVENLDSLLVESVRIHLLADVPLGVLLSGGLDSSLLTAIMSKHKMGNTISTFTAKFDHKFNESDLAKNTAAILNTNHTEFKINTSQINNNIEEHIKIFDDLTTFDGGIITTQLLTQEIQKTGIKVLLLGEGADEIFGGYSWFGLSQSPYRYLPSVIRNAAYYYAISRNLTVSSLKYATLWNQVSRNSSDIFRDITLREIEVQLPNHLLMKVDKGSMASSIEARVPYLDHKLLEFVYSLPQNFKLLGNSFRGGESNEKYILRAVGQKYLPLEIASRKKRGFMLPMNDVINGNIDKVKQYVLSTDSISIKLLGKNTVENLFKDAPSIIKMQNEYFIWRLFILEVWSSVNRIK